MKFHWLRIREDEMPLKICLLGQARLSKNEIPLTVKGYKPIALLAYLILTRKPHTRQHLVDLLYTKADDPRASLRWTLNRLNKTIGKAYFITSRVSIGFNADANYWLDIDALTNGETAVYRGDLLEGIDIRDGRPFMDWLFFERERLRIRYQSLLEHQLQTAEHTFSFSTIIEIGQQLINLDNLHESWYRAVMRAYGHIGNRQAALQLFKTCKAVLADELELAPEKETIVLYEQLQSGSFPSAQSRSAAENAVQPTAHYPPELIIPSSVQRQPFVARQPQLALLEQRLRKSVAGQGQVCLIAGDAGSGKSSLMHVFAQRALANHPELLVGMGSCNAYTGIGDPYLPFRDMLGMLTGDVQHGLAAGFLAQKDAEQLWSGLSETAPIIMDQAPALLNTILPERPFQDRLRMAGMSSTSFSTSSLHESHAAQTDSSYSQARLFGQVTHFLHTAAEKRPLLLIIDDLQWADTTSISLLFHLVRRLTYSRILLLVAYRPEELNRNKRPLHKLLSETKRLYDNILINLNQLSMAENQQLVHELVDQHTSAPVSKSFRSALFQHTNGHPLFTIELIRAIDPGKPKTPGKKTVLQETTLIWDTWPTRIEAIIEERIHTLPEELLQILLVASVEGATFTVQILATVIGREEREIFGALSQLEKRYHLVQDRGEQMIGQQSVSRFQFMHLLFQQFIYGTISSGERRLLHGEVAEAFEAIYKENDEPIIITLAQHYRQARLPGKAVDYLQKAGELAISRYANDEALFFFTQALALISEGEHERCFELLQARASIYEIIGNREAQQQDLALMQKKAVHLSDPYLIQALLQQANFFLIIGANEKAAQTADHAINLEISQQDPQLLAQGYLIWGRAYLQQNQYEKAKLFIERALHLSQHEQMQRVEATGIRSLGLLSERQGEYTAARSYFKQALALHQAADYRRGQASALSNLGEIAYRKGQFKQAISHFTEALQLFKEMGHWQGQGEMLHKLGSVTAVIGQYKRAKSLQRKAMVIFNQIGDQPCVAACLYELANIHYQLNNLNLAREACHKGIQIAQDSGNDILQGLVLTQLGHTLTRLSHQDRAVERYRAALPLLPYNISPEGAMVTRAGLAIILIQQKEVDAAAELLSPILAHLETQSLDGHNHPFFIYIACFQLLISTQKDKAIQLLETAYNHLQTWTAWMDSADEKQQFLWATSSRQQIVSHYLQYREEK
jgi:adenylate cyclase